MKTFLSELGTSKITEIGVHNPSNMVFYSTVNTTVIRVIIAILLITEKLVDELLDNHNATVDIGIGWSLCHVKIWCMTLK